ncbi:MAG: 6-phosphofructokinase [Bacilli bacterium]|nr:6-phosphofructokinase [Bacilli bacterium]
MKIQKNIAILTSGGDCPGMNALINAIVKKGAEYNFKIFFIFDGYYGLFKNQIYKNDKNDFSNIIACGGTILRSSRFEDFKKREIREMAVNNLKKNEIDALICIGGNGTYKGAYELSKMNVNCICIPATIDNDIVLTDFTLGFDTCLNTIVNCVDKIRDTTMSHQKCSIIEVMGRDCGDLSFFSGLALYADIISTSKNFLTINEIIEKIKKILNKNKRNIIIIVSEKLYDVQDLATEIEKTLNYKCSAEILGHLQRGGTPSAFDRILAYKFGTKCIELIQNDKINGCIGIKNNKILYHDFLTIEKEIFKNKK